MAIFLVYSTSSITFGEKSLSRAQNGGHFENFEISNTASIWPQIWKDRPKLCQKKGFFCCDDVIDDVTGWPQSFSLHSCLGRGSPREQIARATSRQFTHAKRRSQWITRFEIAGQRSTSQAYWMTFGLISNIANYLKYNSFWDCDGIDNVMLRLRKFSDFYSRHTVGVAGDDIMFHILVC